MKANAPVQITVTINGKSTSLAALEAQLKQESEAANDAALTYASAKEEHDRAYDAMYATAEGKEEKRTAEIRKNAKEQYESLTEKRQATKSALRDIRRAMSSSEIKFPRRKRTAKSSVVVIGATEPDSITAPTNS